MKKTAKLLSAVLCASLLFSSCNKTDVRDMIDSLSSSSGELDTELKKDLFSKSYKYQMTVPESWEDLNNMNRNRIEDGYDFLWAGNDQIIMQITIVNSPYVGFDAFLGDYIQTINSKWGFSVKKSDFTEKEFNGYNTLFIEHDGINNVLKNSDLDCKLWTYCLDDDKGIIFFETIVLDEYANEETLKFVESMIQTFRKF